LWNDLQKSHSFSLFCAYPMNGFSGEKLMEALNGVCTAHSRVIPAESYTDLANRDERLRVIIQLQQKAKTLEAEICERENAQELLSASLLREQIARAEAESANRMKDEFLATVSHELRTPLNAIMGWSHMLRSGRLDDAAKARAFETIERNANSQAQLIEDILDVSRVITGKLRLNMGPVDVAAVINAAIVSVQLAAESKGIQLEVTLDPSARHTIGDSSRLQQVVWNLLANALKFTSAGGRVEVKVDRADADVRITVSDTGCGISSEFLPFIFDRFRQADSTSTRVHGGLGLGLAIVRHLVELHGGTVQAESAGIGSGSTFTIRLPLAPQRSSSRTAEPALFPEQTPEGEAATLPALDNVRVLLVDDDSDGLHILATALADCRASVETALSTAQALEVLEWYKPDVLVSDLAMPDEDGYSLIAKIKSDGTR
jgi:signal transduction histidine kinase